MSEENAYPLSWPTGWPRTDNPTGSRFATNQPSHGKNRTTLNAATDELDRQIRMLGCREFILSTNLPLRLDGWPRSGQRAPEDAGVAVYFTLDNQKVSLACDKWDRVECNVWALAKHIEALRGQERWGVGTTEQAFTGYMQLPEQSANTDELWQIMGINRTSDVEALRSAFKRQAKVLHPDMSTGDADAFERLKRAFNLLHDGLNEGGAS